MQDRAAQALAKLAVEPEWEARFEPNSYGSRPGRSCHDAIEAIFAAIHYKPKYVLDADIAKCFDRINHDALLAKLRTFPAMRRAIRAWLKAGVMEGRDLFPTTEGTPQGGVISPLLANIALHGLEDLIHAAHPDPHRRHDGGAKVVRYADDFVVLHASRDVVESLKPQIEAWLRGMGLELKPSQTRITHTLRPLPAAEAVGGALGTAGAVAEVAGFDFLGFTVRQQPVGKTHTGRRCGQPLGFKTLITPSKAAIHRHSRAIAEVVHRHRAAPQAALIRQLNPLMRGWARYYAASVAKATFSRLDHELYGKLRHWAHRRHHNTSRRWIAAKYWRLETGRWTLGTPEGMKLYDYSRTPIRRHIKVRGPKSPYDGDWAYWGSRLGRHPDLPPRVAMLLKRQQGRCPWCGLYVRGQDLLEVDHIQPLHGGGEDRLVNLQVLHGHCHDQKTARDATRAACGADDNGHVAEEPDAVETRTSGFEDKPVR